MRDDRLACVPSLFKDRAGSAVSIAWEASFNNPSSPHEQTLVCTPDAELSIICMRAFLLRTLWENMSRKNWNLCVIALRELPSFGIAGSSRRVGDGGGGTDQRLSRLLTVQACMLTVLS